MKEFVKSKGERRLCVATWHFSGFCSERKQKEVGEVFLKITRWSGVLGEG